MTHPLTPIHGGPERGDGAAATTALPTMLLFAVLAGSLLPWSAESVAQTVAAEPTQSSAARPTGPTRLAPDRPVVRTIAATETHQYLLALEANNAVHLRATQLGADIVVTLRASDGTPILEMDTPTGAQGAESVWFIAPSSGDYQVEVKPFESSAGRYELRVAAVRTASPEDTTRVRIQEIYLEANRLGRERATDAHRAAIAKLEEAAALARKIGEHEMAALAIKALLDVDIPAGMEAIALPSMTGKVPVHYSPGYESRAAALRDQLARAVDFFEQRLGVTPKIHLAVLAPDHWSAVAVGGNPYGMPNSQMSRSGAGLVCLPATHDAFDELGRGITAGVPDAVLESVDWAGGSFKEGIWEFGDSIMYHELGHIYTSAYGIAVPNRWVGEFLANYLAFAYRSEHPPHPRLAAVDAIMSAGLLKGPRPKHTSLEDFEALYVGVGFQNYGWYQGQIANRAEAVYKTKALELLKDVKAAFPPHEKRPLSVDVSLERLEKISPGFLEWARQLQGAR